MEETDEEKKRKRSLTPVTSLSPFLPFNMSRDRRKEIKWWGGTGEEKKVEDPFPNSQMFCISHNFCGERDVGCAKI